MIKKTLGKEGSALIVVLTTLMIIAFLVLSSSTLMLNFFNAEKRRVDEQQAYLSAKSVVDVIASTIVDEQSSIINPLNSLGINQELNITDFNFTDNSYGQVISTKITRTSNNDYIIKSKVQVNNISKEVSLLMNKTSTTESTGNSTNEDSYKGGYYITDSYIQNKLDVTGIKFNIIDFDSSKIIGKYTQIEEDEKDIRPEWANLSDKNIESSDRISNYLGGHYYDDDNWNFRNLGNHIDPSATAENPVVFVVYNERQVIDKPILKDANGKPNVLFVIKEGAGLTIKKSSGVDVNAVVYAEEDSEFIFGMSGATTNFNGSIISFGVTRFLGDVNLTYLARKEDSDIVIIKNKYKVVKYMGEGA
ncbi:MAG: hypothetical protein WBO70_03185 [Erysipelotrichaceae bacterium]